MNFFKWQIRKARLIVKTDSEIVEEIHESFYTASEEILKEANQILNHDYVMEKAERLKSIGFGKSSEVSNSPEKIKLALLVEEYKLKYPLYKFITTEQVDQICEKYGLVLGMTSWYIGTMPEKNLKDVERFTGTYKISDLWITDNRVIDMSNYEIRKDGEYEHFFPKNGEGEYAFQRNQGEQEFYSNGVIDGKGYYLSGSRNYLRPFELSIAAPIKDFDLDKFDLEKVGNKLKIKIKDPVVLFPVNKGYVIITAWGAEASDPLVVNETMN